MILISQLEQQLTSRRLLRRAGDRRAYELLLGKETMHAATKWLPLLPGIVKTFVDVGAARGDVANQLDSLFRLDEAVLIEPNIQNLHALRARRLGGRQQVFGCAIGAKQGKAPFNILRSSDSSSLLKPLVAEAQSAFPRHDFETASCMEVDVKTLDEVYEAARLESVDLLKVDVQGAELEVFNGGIGALRRTKMIHVEVSFRQMYEGQPLFKQVYDVLEKSFDLIATSDVVFDASRRPIQADLTFLNKAIDF